FFSSMYALKAQDTHFGIKAGINSSNIKFNDGSDLDSKTGLHIGGLAHIHIQKHFAAQPELVFSMQGGGLGDNNKLKLNYINLPVLLQYMFDEGFRLETGPQIGFMVSGKQKRGDVEVDIKDAYSTVDVSWVFGAGYLFHSGFGLDARYNLGITDISDNNNLEARNRVFQAGIFYQFMHNKTKHK
ncbi:MAG: porin family protein, partial [Chitinophagaceae bacterium]